MSIGNIDGNSSGIGLAGKISDQIKQDNDQSNRSGKGAGFQEALEEALNEINRLSGKADNEIEDLATGRSKNPHQAMIALEEADVAFQLMNAVRSKIVRAYEEIMRTQV